MSLLDTLITPRAATPVPVATKHIPYVETLWNRYTGAKARTEQREEYLRTASGLGVKVAAVEHVANTALDGGKAVATAPRTLDRIKRVLAAGCEPTTPPKGWYCGALTAPKKVKLDNGRKGWPNETWPCKNLEDASRYSFSNRTMWVFEGAIPLDALQKLSAVKDEFDGIRVFSPVDDDFRKLRNPQPRDPVMVGVINYLGVDEYFEIARWDIDKDLAELFRRSATT